MGSETLALFADGVWSYFTVPEDDVCEFYHGTGRNFGVGSDGCGSCVSILRRLDSARSDLPEFLCDTDVAGYAVLVFCNNSYDVLRLLMQLAPFVQQQEFEVFRAEQPLRRVCQADVKRSDGSVIGPCRYAKGHEGPHDLWK